MQYTSGGYALGVTLWRAGELVTLTQPGGASPGGGTWSGDVTSLRMNARGDVSFTDDGRIFVARNGVVSLVAKAGDPLTGGHTFGTLTSSGHLDEDGRVYVSGCSPDYFWLAGSSDEVTGACALVRYSEDDGRETLFATGEATPDEPGYVGHLRLVGVSASGAALLYVERDHESGNLEGYHDFYVVDAGVSRLSREVAFGTTSDELMPGVLRDDGTFFGLADFDDPLAPGSLARAVVTVGATATALLQNGDALPVGGSVAAIRSAIAGVDGESFAVLLDSSDGVRRLFHSRGGALEHVAAVGELFAVAPGDERVVQDIVFEHPRGRDMPSALSPDGELGVVLALSSEVSFAAYGAFLVGLPSAEERPDLVTTLAVLEPEPRTLAETTWRVTVENTSGGAAEDVALALDFLFDLYQPKARGFPSACTLVLDETVDEVTGADCDLGAVAAGATVELDFPVLPREEGAAEMNVTLTQSTSDVTPADDSASLDVSLLPASADLSLVETAWDYRARRSTLQITNGGPSLVENLKLFGESTVELVEARTIDVASDCQLLDGGFRFLCTFRDAKLESGESLSPILDLNPLSNAPVAGTFVYSIESDQDDPHRSNNEVTRSYTTDASFGPCRCVRAGDTTPAGMAALLLGLALLGRKRRRA